MRIAVVGPTHPIKGGVSQHTTTLAEHLAADGHDVQIISWLRQYPQRLYPGQQTVDSPEFQPFEPTHRVLSWNRPDTWVRAARGVRDCDVVVFVHITPVQVPPYRAMLASLRGGRATTVIICHNVLPHERRRLDRILVSQLLDAADRVIVHSEAQADEARSLTRTPISMARIPPFMPPGFVGRAPLPGEHRRLIFFGIVRPYKGLDVALRALAAGPQDVQLRVTGEFWGGTEQTERLCRELDIRERVELRSGYVAADDVPALFGDVDALILPYRSATGSQGVWTGFEFGVPVIATSAGHLADDIRDGIDGLVAEPDSVPSFVDALQRFYQDGVPEQMRAAVTAVDPAPYWSTYLDALLGRPTGQPEPRNHDLGEGFGMQEAAAPGGLLLHGAKRAAEQVLWARVGVERARLQRRGHRPEWPSPVPPTDVLRVPSDYERAIVECRRLHLPLHHDRPKNWDALGAVSTVLNHLGTDIRVLDAGAARYSSVLPWLRVFGVRELVGNNLEFARTIHHGAVRFEPGDITATHYRDSWFDAVTCMSVIEHGVPLEAFTAETARILRPGGLLVVSTDYDQNPPDTTGKTAYGVPVRIFGPDDIRQFVEIAAKQGLELVGDLEFAHEQRPVHWRRTGLEYTFIRLTFIRQPDNGTS